MYNLSDELDDDEFHREFDRYLESLVNALADDEPEIFDVHPLVHPWYAPAGFTRGSIPHMSLVELASGDKGSQCSD